MGRWSRCSREKCSPDCLWFRNTGSLLIDQADSNIHVQRKGRFYIPHLKKKPIVVRSQSHINELADAPELSQRAVYADVSKSFWYRRGGASWQLLDLWLQIHHGQRRNHLGPERTNSCSISSFQSCDQSCRDCSATSASATSFEVDGQTNDSIYWFPRFCWWYCNLLNTRTCPIILNLG